MSDDLPKDRQVLIDRKQEVDQELANIKLELKCAGINFHVTGIRIPPSEYIQLSKRKVVLQRESQNIQRELSALRLKSKASVGLTTAVGKLWEQRDAEDK